MDSPPDRADLPPVGSPLKPGFYLAHDSDHGELPIRVVDDGIDGVCVWGFSIYEGVPGYRTLGLRLSEWVGRKGNERIAFSADHDRSADADPEQPMVYRAPPAPLPDAPPTDAIEARLCDDAGEVSAARVGNMFNPQLTFLQQHSNLSVNHGGTGYTGGPFACTSHAHYGGQHVVCTSPAHKAAVVIAVADAPPEATDGCVYVNPPAPKDDSIPGAMAEADLPPRVPRETPDAKRGAAREANRLAFHESKAVCHDCAHAGHVSRFYRCRWCGVYFCNVCSTEHFGNSADVVIDTDGNGNAMDVHHVRPAVAQEVDRLRAENARLQADLTTWRDEASNRLRGIVHRTEVIQRQCAELEVLRASYAQYQIEVERLRAALQDFAEHGTRHDLTPSTYGTPDACFAQVFAHMKSMDAHVRKVARGALG